MTNPYNHCRDCSFYAIEDRGTLGKSRFCSNEQSHMFFKELSICPPANSCDLYQISNEPRPISLEGGLVAQAQSARREAL